jgi:hypothetical protein
MKTEHFDDTIRRKVKSIYHGFNEEDVERVYNHVASKNKPISFWLGNRTSILISILALLTTSSLLYLNYKQAKEQKSLIVKLEQLQKEMKKVNPNTETNRVDTVYITNNVSADPSINNQIPNSNNTIPTISTKRQVPTSNAIDHDNINKSKNGVGGNHLSKNDQTLNSTPAHNPKNKKSVLDRGRLPIVQDGLTTNSQKGKESHTGTDMVIQRKKSNISPKQSDSQNAKEYLLPSPSDQNHTEGLLLGNQFQNAHAPRNSDNNNNGQRNRLSQNPINLKDKVQSGVMDGAGKSIRSNYNIVDARSTTNMNDFTMPYNQLTTNANDSITTNKSVLDSLSSGEKKMRPIDSTAVSGPKLNKPSNFLNELKFQTGLTVEMANKEYGFGILGEMLIKRFGLSMGIKYLSINSGSNYDANTTRFKNSYLPDWSDNYQFKDIAIQAYSVQLPIALSYYQPLKKNYSILFSFGTDLDLYIYQNVNFACKDNGSWSNYENWNMTLNHSAVLLNNIMLSPGLQKQWGHFVLQVCPFISPQMKEVEYKDSNIYFGLRSKILYRF